MKYVLLSDLHLSDRPPSSCTETYLDDLFGLLEQARQVTRRYGDAMVWAGDVFHCKAPSRVSHRLVHRVCEFVQQCTKDFPVYVLAGNHDMANDRYESLTETQPLGMLYRAGAEELRGWNGMLYGVPWLQGYGSYARQGDDIDPLQPLLDIEVRLGDALKDYRKHVYEYGTGKYKPLVVTHAPLYPPGRELTYEYFPAERWAEAMGGGYGHVFYGHVHEMHGTYAAGNTVFCNNGALSRGSLHEYNLTRSVGVTLYDDETGKFDFHPLDAKPAAEVFRLQEKQRVTDVQGRLDDFLASAGSATIEVCNVESVLAHVKSLGLGRPLENLVEELLNG